MSMKDIRDLLMKQMHELADSDASSDEVKLRVERARASAEVARVYVETVETEISAIQLFDKTGVKASVIEAGQLPAGRSLK